MRSTTRRAHFFAFFMSVCAMSCGGGTTPTAPTPVAPTPAPAIVYPITDFTAQNVSRESLCSPAGSTEVMIDQLEFRFSNPSGRAVSGMIVTNGESFALRYGELAQCNPNPCSAQFSIASPAPVCIVDGTPTGPYGTVRLFMKRYFEPSTIYRVRLGEDALASPVILSGDKLAEAAVVRMPGVPNDRVAFYNIVPSPIERVGPNYLTGVEADFYVPPQLVASPYQTEVQYSWYHGDGRLFAMNRSTILSSNLHVSGTVSSVATNVGPPWRIVIRMRQSLGTAAPNANPFYCNSDLSFPGQGRCTTDQMPPPPGPVLTEDSRELTIP